MTTPKPTLDLSPGQHRSSVQDQSSVQETHISRITTNEQEAVESQPSISFLADIHTFQSEATQEGQTSTHLLTGLLTKQATEAEQELWAEALCLVPRNQVQYQDLKQQTAGLPRTEHIQERAESLHQELVIDPLDDNFWSDADTTSTHTLSVGTQTPGTRLKNIAQRLLSQRYKLSLALCILGLLSLWYHGLHQAPSKKLRSMPPYDQHFYIDPARIAEQTHNNQQRPQAQRTALPALQHTLPPTTQPPKGNVDR